jgi:hypothetical protein
LPPRTSRQAPTAASSAPRSMPFICACSTNAGAGW